MEPETQSSSKVQVSDTRRLAMLGSVWTVLGYGASNIVRLGSNLVLARLLFPGAFGLMLLVSVFIQGLQMLSDIGIAPSIIRHDRGDEQRFLDTAWTIQVVRGFALWLLASAGAPLAAWYFEEPSLAAMIPVAALTALIGGFTSTKYVTANRHMKFERRTLIDLCSQCSGVALMIGWAWSEGSVWALVAGGVLSSLVRTLLSHVALPGQGNRFCFDRPAFRELLSFGKWVFVSSLLTFGAGQIDRLMLAKLVPIDRLGLFGVAQNLVTLPVVIASALAETVAFPLLALRARENPAGLGGPTLHGRAVLLPLCVFVLVGLTLLAPAFFRTLYDSRYADAGLIAALSALPCWISMLTLTADRALLALGDARALAMSNITALIAKTIFCMAGFHLGGLEGLIIGSAAGNLAAHLVIILALSKRNVSIWRQDLRFTLISLACVAAGLGLLYFGMREFGSARRPILEVAMTIIVIVPCGLWAMRSLRSEIARP